MAARGACGARGITFNRRSSNRWNSVRTDDVCFVEASEESSKTLGERLSKIVLRYQHPSDRRSDETIAGLDLIPH
jgi:hypothetical protein